MLAAVQEMKYCVWKQTFKEVLAVLTYHRAATRAHAFLCSSYKHAQKNQSNTYIARNTGVRELLGNYHSVQLNTLGLCILGMVLKALV